uniref:Ig-like domain-containing protein n=1 Tax=Poecilia mexicana TaxID=48701 RepID=A0A3B3YV46_9TELE
TLHTFFLILLMDLFPVCSDELKIEVKTVTAGQNVTLSCPRQINVLYRETFYWIRLVSGNWPEFLGSTVNFKIDDVSKIPHIQTKQEEGEFILDIKEAKRNDTGLYYCIKIRQLDFIFMTGTFLKVKVNAENSDTLQCSVLSDSEKKTCPADNRVYWFKAGPDHSHPSLLYLQENSGDECENSPEAQTAQKCFYNFSGTSDSGIHHCAVAACGQILFGNGLVSQGNDITYMCNKLSTLLSNYLMTILHNLVIALWSLWNMGRILIQIKDYYAYLSPKQKHIWQHCLCSEIT